MSEVVPTEKKGWSAREVLPSSRRVTQWTFASLRFVLLICILFLVSWVVNYNPVSWDLTEERLFSLSEQSRAVLESLEQPVELIAFVRGGNNPGLARLLSAYSDRSDLVKHRLVDLEAEPALATELQVQDYGTLIARSGDSVRRADAIEEPEITNAVLAVTRGQAVPVCFVVGHGERGVSDRERFGLSAATGVLAQTNYEVRTVNLAAAAPDPDGCAVVVIAGPTSDLLEAEVETLRAYLEDGGRLLALLESRVELPYLSALLAEYGVRPHDDFVIDTAKNGQAFGLGIQVPMVDSYGEHPVTEGFRLMTLYPLPRSIGIAEEMPEGLEARALATTSRSSWGETEVTPGAAARWDEGEDLQGPLPLVVAVAEAVEETPRAFRERQRRGEPKPVGDPRLIVAGDVDFASNAFFNWQGNGDLLLNSVNWLSGQQELISIRPKQVANKRVALTNARRMLVFVLLVILLPVFPAVVGIVMMMKKVK